MSHTLASEPAVVLRSNYVHLRAMLSVALAAVVGLTIAVVLLASNTNSTAGTTATHANAVASQKLGAKLDHSGRNALITGRSDAPGAGATRFGAQQLRGAYPGHH